MRSRGGWITCALLLAFVGACGGDGGDHNPGELYPDRENQYREDQERIVGESVMIGGYTATVDEIRLDEPARAIRVNVTITNRDDDPQRVDATQWTLVNPRVQTIDADASTLPVSELAGGDTVTAEVSFVVDPDERGAYYVQFKPETLDAARGIWQFTYEPAP